MRHLKTFESWSKTNEEIFGLFSREEEPVNPKAESKWLKKVAGKALTYEEIAKKFGVDVEHVSDYEKWLDEKSVNGKIEIIPFSGGEVSELDEEEYKFQMEANYAASLEEEDSSL